MHIYKMKDCKISAMLLEKNKDSIKVFVESNNTDFSSKEKKVLSEDELNDIYEKSFFEGGILIKNNIVEGFFVPFNHYFVMTEEGTPLSIDKKTFDTLFEESDENVNIGIAKLYDANKDVVESTEKVMSSSRLRQELKEIRKHINNKYSMLLCREKADYTLFNLEKCKETFVKDLHECLFNRGEVYKIEKGSGEGSYEIWIKTFDDNKMYCYIYFPYDMGVIE